MTLPKAWKMPAFLMTPRGPGDRGALGLWLFPKDMQARGASGIEKLNFNVMQTFAKPDPPAVLLIRMQPIVIYDRLAVYEEYAAIVGTCVERVDAVLRGVHETGSANREFLRDVGDCVGIHSRANADPTGFKRIEARHLREITCVIFIIGSGFRFRDNNGIVQNYFSVSNEHLVA
jgi:hypothetical protein